MITPVTMPQLGETVAEGTVTRWLRAVGDPIQRDEPLLEVSTDKVDTEVVAPVSGVLAEILVEVDTTVDVGTVLARISDESAVDVPGPLPAARPAPAAAALTGAAPVPATAPRPASAAPPVHRRHEHSPRVRRLAVEQGVALAGLAGTGPNGRVRPSDVLAAVRIPPPGAAPAPAAGAGPAPDAGVGPVQTPVVVSSPGIVVVEVDISRVVRSDVPDLALVVHAVTQSLRFHRIVQRGPVALSVTLPGGDGPVTLALPDAGDLNLAGLARRLSDPGSPVPVGRAEPILSVVASAVSGVLIEVAARSAGGAAVLTVGAAVDRPVALRLPDGEAVAVVRPTAYLSLAHGDGPFVGRAAGFLAYLKEVLERGDRTAR